VQWHNLHMPKSGPADPRQTPELHSDPRRVRQMQQGHGFCNFLAPLTPQRYIEIL